MTGRRGDPRHWAGVDRDRRDAEQSAWNLGADAGPEIKLMALALVRADGDITRAAAWAQLDDGRARTACGWLCFCGYARRDGDRVLILPAQARGRDLRLGEPA